MSGRDFDYIPTERRRFPLWAWLLIILAIIFVAPTLYSLGWYAVIWLLTKSGSS